MAHLHNIRVCKDTDEGRPQVLPQSQRVYNVVLGTRRQLHEAREALEGPVWIHVCERVCFCVCVHTCVCVCVNVCVHTCL